MNKPVLSPAHALIALAAVISIALPSLAIAASPFLSGAQATSVEFSGIAQIICGIAIVAAGLAAVFGLINKAWLFGCFLGTLIVFAPNQMISMFRSFGGV